MCVNANAVLRSWTLLAAFGGSYAPDIIEQTPSIKHSFHVFINTIFFIPTVVTITVPDPCLKLLVEPKSLLLAAALDQWNLTV